MKGPGVRVDVDVRRYWRCPRCSKVTRTGGHVVAVPCLCAGERTWMVLEKTPQRPRYVPPPRELEPVEDYTLEPEPPRERRTEPSPIVSEPLDAVVAESGEAELPIPEIAANRDGTDVPSSAGNSPRSPRESGPLRESGAGSRRNSGRRDERSRSQGDKPANQGEIPGQGSQPAPSGKPGKGGPKGGQPAGGKPRPAGSTPRGTGGKPHSHREGSEQAKSSQSGPGRGPGAEVGNELVSVGPPMDPETAGGNVEGEPEPSGEKSGRTRKRRGRKDRPAPSGDPDLPATTATADQPVAGQSASEAPAATTVVVDTQRSTAPAEPAGVSFESADVNSGRGSAGSAADDTGEEPQGEPTPGGGRGRRRRRRGRPQSDTGIGESSPAGAEPGRPETGRSEMGTSTGKSQPAHDPGDSFGAGLD